MSRNILHLMGMDSTKYGGIERFNIELSRQLTDKGFHSVFVYEEYPQVQQFVNDLLSTNAELVVINSQKNVIKFCNNIWLLYKKYDFCLMHAHFTKARFYAIPIAVVMGIKSIFYTFHSRIDTLDKIKLHTRFWYWTMNKFCKVVSVSREIEKIAKLNWKQIKCKTLCLGVNEIQGCKIESRKYLSIPLESIVLTCIANFNYIKGLDVLVKSIRQLVNNGDFENTLLYIIGQSDDDKNALQQLIDELNVSKYIYLEGIKNNIHQYLLASDIYIQPSRSEGLPMALMEACSAGLPIVASRVGGIPEAAINNRNAILCEVENYIELGNNIRDLIKDFQLRQLFGIQSKKIYKENFSIKKNVEKLVEYYDIN